MEEFIIDILIPFSLGWLLDLWLGDPERLPHPVVYMGKWIAFFEKKLNEGNHRLAKGAVFAVFSVAATFALVWGLLKLPVILFGNTMLATAIIVALKALLIFFCLAGHTLRKEVKMVFEALEKGLDNGRKQVARIVGRDTNELSAHEVRTAALETLAENLSDGVIAPICWFVVLGVPGMLTYKMINTMDSMIGYQNPRYKDFGCWAAHIDDVANYLPARITAFLMVAVSSLCKGTSFTHLCRFVCTYGPKHASPNSGWPEAALAAILDCRFGGPHNYFGEVFHKPYIGTNPRELNSTDVQTSIAVCFGAEVLGVVIAIALLAL